MKFTIKEDRSGIGACRTCEYSQIMQRGLQTTVLCAASYSFPIRIKRPLDSCSMFKEHAEQDRGELEKIAYVLEQGKNRKMGFVPPSKRKSDPGDF